MTPTGARRPLASAENGVVSLCAAQAVAVWGEHVLLWNGLALWAYDHLGGTHGIGIALFVVTLPALLSYPAGRLVSDVPPRRTLRVCGAMRALLILVLVLFAGTAWAHGGGPAPHVVSPLSGGVVLGIAALVILVDSFFMPVLKASLPLWAGDTDGQRGRANALLEATDAPGFVLGPPAAAFLYLQAGLSGLAVALALSYGVALVLLMRLPPPAPLAPDGEPEESAGGEPNPFWLPTTFFLGISALAMLVLGLVQTLALPFIRETLHLPEIAFGVLSALMGLGVTLGAGLWSLPPVLRVPLSLRLFLSLLLAGGALMTGAEARSAAFCGAAWLAGGIGFVGITLSLTTVLQEAAYPARRTRILGLAHTLEAAGLLAGEAVAPLLASLVGLRGAFQCGGLLLGLLVVSGLVWLAANRQVKHKRKRFHS